MQLLVLQVDITMKDHIIRAKFLNTVDVFNLLAKVKKLVPGSVRGVFFDSATKSLNPLWIINRKSFLIFFLLKQQFESLVFCHRLWRIKFSCFLT